MSTELDSGVVAAVATHEEEFEAGRIVSIVAGHFTHDTFAAFLPPLLPLLIERLSLSLALAGSLAAFVQVPALVNPLIGYLGDRISLRYLVIFAPAVTATLMSSLGLAPNYVTLAIILAFSGISSAAFHAPAPAMIARISGTQTGKGMSWFMAGGEMGRTIGPLLAVWAVSTWTLEGYFRVVVVGWAASLILYWRLRDIPGRQGSPASLREAWPQARRLFGPIAAIMLLRGFVRAPLSIYLPTYLRSQGASLVASGASLAIFEFAAVGGALVSGPLSDRLGRRRVLLISMVASTLLLLIFVQLQGWALVPVLVALGFASLLTTPVIMATVQDEMPEYRAAANGLFVLLAFLSLSVATVVTGAIGDEYGLRATYYVSAVCGLLAIVPVIWLPERAAPGQTIHH